MPEPESKTEEKGNLPPEVMKVLEDLKVKVDGMAKTDPTPPPSTTQSDRRAAIQKSLGFNDEQMAAHEESIMRAQAPVIERTAWQAIEKKPEVDTYRKEIEKELELYPQERRTPELMEKIYFFVRGKHADTKPATPSPDPKVRSTRVSSGPGYSGSDPGLSTGGEGGGSTEDDQKLNDMEKFVAQKLGVSEKDYAQARNVGKSIRELRIPDTRQPTSLADMELRKMTGGR